MKKVRAKKKKIYVLSLSQFFPKGHIHAGEETFFREKLALGLHGRGVRTEDWFDVGKVLSVLEICDNIVKEYENH